MSRLLPEQAPTEKSTVLLIDHLFFSPFDPPLDNAQLPQHHCQVPGIHPREVSMVAGTQSQQVCRCITRPTGIGRLSVYFWSLLLLFLLFSHSAPSCVVRCSSCVVTSSGMRHISHIQTLTELSLQRVAIPNRALEKIGQLKSVHSMDVSSFLSFHCSLSWIHFFSCSRGMKLILCAQEPAVPEPERMSADLGRRSPTPLQTGIAGRTPSPAVSRDPR